MRGVHVNGAGAAAQRAWPGVQVEQMLVNNVVGQQLAHSDDATIGTAFVAAESIAAVPNAAPENPGAALCAQSHVIPLSIVNCHHKRAAMQP